MWGNTKKSKKHKKKKKQKKMKKKKKKKKTKTKTKTKMKTKNESQRVVFLWHAFSSSKGPGPWSSSPVSRDLVEGKWLAQGRVPLSS